MCIFFDMKKAYDTTWHYGILKAVYECGIRGHLAYFIVKVVNTIQSESSKYIFFSSSAGGGCTAEQCAVLLPLCPCNKWNNYMSPSRCKMLSVCRRFHDLCRIQLFASCKVQTPIAINNIARWTTSHGFTISEEKTIAVNFNRKRNHT